MVTFLIGLIVGAVLTLAVLFVLGWCMSRRERAEQAARLRQLQRQRVALHGRRVLLRRQLARLRRQRLALRRVRRARQTAEQRLVYRLLELSQGGVV
jgi:hypothetical protein